MIFLKYYYNLLLVLNINLEEFFNFKNKNYYYISVYLGISIFELLFLKINLNILYLTNIVNWHIIKHLKWAFS